MLSMKLSSVQDECILRERNSSTPVTDETSPKQKVPSLPHLKSLVQKIIAESCWWEKYGVDLWILLTGLWFVPMGLCLLRWHESRISFALGVFLLGYAHMMFITKGAHLTSHGALGLPDKWNRMLTVFFSDICGAFSSEEGLKIHIQVHHPYTNIIGLGDSSSWRVPFLNRIMYLFIVPHLLPILAPLFSIQMLWPKWKAVLKFVLCASLGFVGQYLALVLFGKLSTGWAIFCLFYTRAMLQCCYIHINIFQHIGMSFYELENKPQRLHQMATGVLNLAENVFLEFCFGQSLINCHVEHHLFPRLSDQMCLKVKPLVSSYLKSHGMPYNEDTYMGRLKDFYYRYDELMVNAPPITKFIGIQ